MRPLPRRLQHGEEATVVEHLGELRSRLVVCLIAIGVTTGVAFGFHHHILTWLNRPLPVHNGQKVLPTTIGVAEPFLTSFWVSFWAGLVFALPIILWQTWGFFAPAFHHNVQRKVVGFALIAGLLFASGIAFGYYIVLKPAIGFLTNYDSNLYNIQIRARDYYSFVCLVMLAVGIVFQVPLFLLGLVRIGVLTSRKLRRNWRIGIVSMTALAVALPGVDPVTTMLEMIPLIGLYLITLALSGFFERRWHPHRETAPAAE